VSQRDDLLSQLREARPIAPAELREHVRRIAEATAAPRKRRATWRRALVVGLPVAAAVAWTAILFPGGESRTVSGPPPDLAYQAPSAPKSPDATAKLGVAGTGSSAAAPTHQAALPAPAPNRVQRITTSLELRLPNTQAVSDATKQAVAITRSLGGYTKALDVHAEGATGYASLVLRVPKPNVQRAVSRLSELGTIVGESVRIQDLQAQVDAAGAKITRLQTRLAYWQSQPPSTEAEQHVAALSARVAKLRRGRASTVHAASYATVSVQMTTKPAPAAVHRGHGPLHNLGVVFRWVGIVAVYVLALAAPFVLVGLLVWLVVRAVRRRRENELLGST
jgi:hypothetical protein